MNLEPTSAPHSHVIETIHAIALPLGASFSLIIMFFFFDSLQTVFIICTASKYRHLKNKKIIRNQYQSILI